MNTNKKYIPFSYKKSIIDSVVNACMFEDENGLKKIDVCYKQYFTYKFLAEYFGKEFPEDKELEVYDQLCESGEMKSLINQISDEDYYFIIDSIDEQLKVEVNTNNSIEGIVSRLGLILLSKFDEYLNPKSISKLAKSLEKINPEIVDIIKDLPK